MEVVELASLLDRIRMCGGSFVRTVPLRSQVNTTSDESALSTEQLDHRACCNVNSRAGSEETSWEGGGDGGNLAIGS